VIEGKEYHFSAGGLFNGLVLLIDDETRTYWDHITGEAVHGPMKGAAMEVFSINMTNLEAALKDDPQMTLSRKPVHLFARIFGFIHRNAFRHGGFLPPRFRGTMGEEDKRLPRMAHGVGVVIGDGARFFTMDQMKNPISLDWGGRQMNLCLSPVDKVPAAIWEDESRPFQLFTRWYGFSYTYPGCDIWGAEEGS
jgi:hypothetical protein